MIIKCKSYPRDEGWVWLDGIERVQAFGWLVDTREPEPGTLVGPRTFTRQVDLHAAIAAVWGEPDHREFAHEVWPEVSEQHPAQVRTVVGYRRDGAVLVIASDEAYLLSDLGATVERL